MAKHGGDPRPGVKSSKPAAGGAPDSPAIPDKLYFRIGEVAALCRVPTYVLRFWQTEFRELHPGKSGTGQRLYRKRDVEMALHIKRLLHEQGYTIAGARAVLAEEAAVPARLRAQRELPMAAAADALSGAPPDSSGERAKARLQQVRMELRELLGLLERKPALRPAPLAPEPLFREVSPDRAPE